MALPPLCQVPPEIGRPHRRQDLPGVTAAVMDGRVHEGCQ
jgi:hypothetical protein